MKLLRQADNLSLKRFFEFTPFFDFLLSLKQAYRLQQRIHDEISNRLKLIDKLRTMASTDERSYLKIKLHKNKITEMLKILAHLKELLQNLQQISIDTLLDLMSHKFNVIVTESSLNELLSFESQTLSPSNFERPSFDATKDDFTSMYLNDILTRCNELKHEQLHEHEHEHPNQVARENVMTDNVVREIIWPEIMDRLGNYLNHRKKIKVDLKRLTSEEVAMVECIGNECVQSIIEDLFRNKHN